MKTRHRHKKNLKTKLKTKKQTRKTCGKWYRQTAWFGLIHFSGHTIEQAIDDMLAKFNASAAAYFAQPPAQYAIPDTYSGPYTRDGSPVRASSVRFTQKITNGKLVDLTDPHGNIDPNYPDWTMFELFVYPPRNGSPNLGWVPP